MVLDVFDQGFKLFIEILVRRFQSGDLRQQLIDVFVLLKSLGNQAPSVAVQSLDGWIEDFLLGSRVKLQFLADLLKDLIPLVVGSLVCVIELAEKTLHSRMVLLKKLKSIH